jgi:signal transduction histidine kinase
LKADNLHKKVRLANKAIEKAENRRDKGLFEGEALAYLEAAALYSENKGFSEKVASCFNNAGISYYDAKKYEQARKYLERAVKMRLEILGDKHPDTANSLCSLGAVYRAIGDFDKSERHDTQALQIRLANPNSPSEVVDSLNNLGILYLERGHVNIADQFYQTAIDFAKTHDLKNENPSVEAVLTNQDMLLQEVTRLKKEKLETQAALYQSKKLEYLGQMATLMAHNINQPISVLRMAASGALSDINDKLFDPETELKPLLEKMLAQTERLSDMMGNFRQFARGDRTVLAAVNLNSVIDAIYQLLFVAQFQLENIELQKQFSASPIAHANDWALQEMLISLLSNARAAVKDKPQKQVAIITWQEAGQVGFCIEDNGDGVTPENLPNLFTPFLSSKEEGMGLGLYFCRQIAHDLGGSIDYYPAPLGGAGFKISLPAGEE